MKKKLVLLLILATLSVGNVLAQYSVSFPFLLQNTDTRSSGMGNTYTGDRGGSVNVFGNYASVFAISRQSVGVSYDLSIFRKIEKSRQMFHALGIDYRYRSHAFGIGVRYWGGLKVQGRNEEGDIYTISPNDISLDVAYAYQIIPVLSAFIGTNIIYSYMGQIAHTFGFSGGLFFRRDCRLGKMDGAYAIGVHINNVGPRAVYSNGKMSHALPAYIRVAPSLSLNLSADHALALALSVGYVFSPEKQSMLSGGMGLEYLIKRRFALRAGYFSQYERGFTFGGGFLADRFSFNLAYSLGPLKSFNVFKSGISYHF